MHFVARLAGKLRATYCTAGGRRQDGGQFWTAVVKKKPEVPPRKTTR